MKPKVANSTPKEDYFTRTSISSTQDITFVLEYLLEQQGLEFICVSERLDKGFTDIRGIRPIKQKA